MQSIGFDVRRALRTTRLSSQLVTLVLSDFNPGPVQEGL